MEKELVIPPGQYDIKSLKFTITIRFENILIKANDITNRVDVKSPL